MFLGDSIVRDLDTSSMARHTLNLAIPGDTTAGLLGRVRAYGSVRTARGVVIGVGVNDLYYRPVPEAVANYRGILDQVPAGTPVLVLAALPVDERAQPAFRNADVRRLDEALAALCGERPGCRFVDPSPRLVDGTGNLAPADHVGDGVHLSAVGHDAYWGVVNAAVLAACRRPGPSRRSSSSPAATGSAGRQGGRCDEREGHGPGLRHRRCAVRGHRRSFRAKQPSRKPPPTSTASPAAKSYRA